MKYNCEVIRDLLPLCCEDIASKESKRIVEEHCKECRECKKIQEEMLTGDFTIEDSGDGLKKFIKECKRNFNALLAIFCYTILVVAGVIHGKNGGPTDTGGIIILYTGLLFPVAGAFCNMAVASQKLKIKYVFPILCGFVGDMYQYIVLNHFDYEPNIFSFGFNFVPALVGFLIGLKMSGQGTNTRRRFNEGMMAGIAIMVLASVLGLLLPAAAMLAVIIGVGGAVVYVVSAKLKRKI